MQLRPRGVILLNMDCDVYQLKIKYDNTIGKFGIVFIDSKEAASLNREVILEKVRSITSRFDDTKEGDINIQYLDDEKNFVNLTDDQSCIWDLLRCAVPVPNADFKRINLRIEESNSPLPRSQLSSSRKRIGERNQLSPSNMPSSSKETKSSSLSRRSLHFHTPSSSVSSAMNQKTGTVRPQKQPDRFTDAAVRVPIFASPLEKFLETQKLKLTRLQEDERKIVDRIDIFQVKKNARSSSTGPTCSNCHRQEGHNRLNCPYDACDSSFHCGAINKHPDEKSQLKEYEKQRQELKKEIMSLRNEIAAKEAATRSIQQRYVYQVRQQLIESDPQRYLHYGNDGQRVENWFQLNRDAKKLEVLLKGKLPRPDSDIRGLLFQAELDGPQSQNNSSINKSGKTSVRNPYKKLWQDKGVDWPMKNTEDLCSVSVGEENNTSDENDTLDCDDYLLAIGIRESLKHSASEDMYTRRDQTPTLFATSSSTSSPSINPSQATCVNSNKNEQLCGLDALAEACNTVSDGDGR